MGDSAVSVAKGVFVVKNGNISKYKRPKGKKAAITENIFADKLWYNAYQKLWQTIEARLEEVNKNMFTTLLETLVTFIKTAYEFPVSEVPTAVLLTGINMPDHSAQFSALVNVVRDTVSPHVVALHPEECHKLKNMMENIVQQFIYGKASTDANNEDVDERAEDNSRLTKSVCTLTVLQSWYEQMYGVEGGEKKIETRNKRKPLVVIVPDFESLNDKIMQNFIQIIRMSIKIFDYILEITRPKLLKTNFNQNPIDPTERLAVTLRVYVNVLPIVLVFGVATSLTALHKNLPYHVSSKISIQVFNSQPSTVHLNKILEGVFFSENCPFRVGAKVFNCFIDVFLFYDLSVKGFIKNFKFALMDHFSNGNVMALCGSNHNMKKILSNFTADDYKALKNLQSFQSYMEKQDVETVKKLNKNVEAFNNFIVEKIDEFHNSLRLMHFFLKQLLILVHDLPKAPLGKQIRELYTATVSKNICESAEFRECFQLLRFQSKDELTVKVERLIELTDETYQCTKMRKPPLASYANCLRNHLIDMQNSSATPVNGNEIEEEEIEEFSNTKVRGRRELKEKLLKLTQKNKWLNAYELARQQLISFLRQTFEEHLQNLKSTPFYDIFFFNDMSIKRFIIGSHRAAIHTALSDPESYLKCKCCVLSNDTPILNTMPDVSIAYRLHLEYGKHINLYDWLQSFIYVLDPECKEEDEEQPLKVPPELHARFTQAVADLEFLGFIKSSKRKPDHVQRLTWGG